MGTRFVLGHRVTLWLQPSFWLLSMGVSYLTSTLKNSEYTHIKVSMFCTSQLWFGWRFNCLVVSRFKKRPQKWTKMTLWCFWVWKWTIPFCSFNILTCWTLVGSSSFRYECIMKLIFQSFSRAGPRGRAREWATLGVHPLSWLLSNNRLEEVCGTRTKGTFSSRLLLSKKDKGWTPSVAHSLPLPLYPGFC